MKKLLILTFSLALLCTAAACSDASAGQKENEATTENSVLQDDATQTAAGTMTGESDDGSVTQATEGTGSEQSYSFG